MFSVYNFYCEVIMKLILASNSPRRKKFLSDAGFDFEVVVSAFNELDCCLSPEEVAKANAFGKANEVFNSLQDKSDAVVLGADTVVFIDGKILGKPTDNAHAKQMLESLSGREHTVVTGYAIVSKDKTIVDSVSSGVVFNSLTQEIIEEYVATGSPLDKAGGYGIQDDFGLIKGYTGSLSNIIGLPIEDITPLLKQVMGKK